MKRLLLTLLLSAATLGLSAQPVLTGVENFKKGDSLVWEDCSPNVWAGPGGANQTWDFSKSLMPATKTSVETLIDPATTSYSHLFPAATTAEKYSNGQFVYYYTQNNKMYLTGFVDTVQGITIQYPNSVQFLQNPITYNDQFTDTFTDYMSIAGMDMSGGGVMNVVADGYGTLIVPNKTYTNALRVKFIQTEVDTMAGMTTTTTSVTYSWFVQHQASAVMKIDSTHSQGGAVKTVQYLQSELLGINQSVHANEIMLYPNPANSEITLEASENGTLIIRDMTGRQINGPILVKPGKNNIHTEDLANGIYLLQLNTPAKSEVSKIEIRH